MDLPARPTISYDDITTPATWIPPEHTRDDDRGENGRPAKRGRWSKRSGGGVSNGHRRAHPHWDEPWEQQPIMSYDAVNPTPSAPPNLSSTNNLDPNEASHVQSSEPTIQRPSFTTAKPKKRSNKKSKNKIPKAISLADAGLWDDRALTDAWDAANEEYERMHGPGKKWKNEPIHKASLWYAETKIVLDGDQVNGADGDAEIGDDDEVDEGYTHDEDVDVDFDHTYNGDEEEEAEVHHEITEQQSLFPTASSNSFPASVVPPTVDLANTVAPIPPLGALGPNTRTPQEAFEQALNASYWLGYWSAIHSQQLAASSMTREEENIQN